MLEARHLRKAFTSSVAVADVSFRVKPGEIFGLLGPNGAGKTTTIRMLLNILRPDSGEISYHGTPFSDTVRRGIGYLPEERGLYRKSKLLDTILYFAELRGMDRAAARTEAFRWLERFDLVSYANKRIDELSKGNQQKIQFTVAVLHNPWLVILDEPFSGLDPLNRALLTDILLELRRQGKAVVFSTHQMDEAERLSESICLINRGVVVLEGSVGEIKHRYGKNSVRVEFSGDGSFMTSIPGTGSVLLFHNTAEFELGNGMTSQALLEYLLARVEIRKFQVLQPSLESVFMKVIDGGKEGRAEGEEQAQSGELRA